MVCVQTGYPEEYQNSMQHEKRIGVPVGLLLFFLSLYSLQGARFFFLALCGFDFFSLNRIYGLLSARGHWGRRLSLARWSFVFCLFFILRARTLPSPPRKSYCLMSLNLFFIIITCFRRD
ncbi:hypothetical protein EDC01DRAFT_69790 [Geopyxis carbonaria]|nr:hypothetical protein EDC01DRAFT_69790 [Geopyxis carbonaria]